MELVIYVVSFILIVGFSFLLAWWSMKDFRDTPNLKVSYGTFLLKHPQELNQDFFERIHRLGLDRGIKKRINPFIISLESLIKGTTRSLVIHGPREICRQFPQFGLLELEDYTQKIAANKLLCFELTLKKGSKPLDIKNQELLLLKHFQLEESEYLFLQIVMAPFPGDSFQVSLRVVISAKDSNRRVEIARKFEQLTLSQLNLGRSVRRRSSLAIFQDFKTRSLVPAQIEKFSFPKELILKIVKS